MSTSIHVCNPDKAPSGSNVYFIVRNPAGQAWYTVTPAFENFNASHITDYDVAMTEQSTSAWYVGTFPSAISAGQYMIDVRLRVGGSPAVSDTSVGNDSVVWDGTDLVYVSSDVTSNVTAIKAKTDNLPGDPADASVISGRFDTLDTSVAGVPALVWSYVVWTGWSALRVLKGLAAVAMGKSSGHDADAPVYRDVLDTQNQVSGTVDADGNRLTVTHGS